MLSLTPIQRSALTSILAIIGSLLVTKGWISEDQGADFANNTMIVGGLVLALFSFFYDLLAAGRSQKRIEQVQIASNFLKVDGIFGKKTEKELLRRLKD